MTNSFGAELRQFALSVDIIDKRTVSDLRRIQIEKYIRTKLEFDDFMLFQTCKVGGKPGLKPGWGEENDDYGPYKLLRSSDEQPDGHGAYCCIEEVPLWIVSKDRGILRKATEFIDLWSNRKNIPPYREVREVDYCTTVAIPLKRGGRVFGALLLVALRHFPPTEPLKKELKAIADAIAILYSLVEENKSRQEGTNKAISNLQEALVSGPAIPLTSPQIFFAYPANSDKEVVGTIKSVLDDYNEKLKVVSWKKISTSGNVNAQILEAIYASSFGICYFSERVKTDPPYVFQDNPNVLFEAGMFHGLTKTKSATPLNWIPVREAPPPKIPFDFMAERIVEVTRMKNGELNKDTLIDTLIERIDKLLES